MARPGASATRLAVERRSAVALVFLSQRPKLLLPALSLGLLVLGLLLPGGAGAGCLALLALLVGWLGYLSWPAADGAGRLLRLLALGLLVALAVRHLL